MKTRRILRYHLSKILGRPFTQRRYIDSRLGVEGFLKSLKHDGVNYVVLRWFEDLPQVAPGEDIDILFADQDIAKINALTKIIDKEGDTPCDIYTVSGLPGSSSHSLPYYPVTNAKTILANATWIKDMVRVPAPDDHFLSICFHAVYRKGYLAGLPSEDSERNKKVILPLDHDYKGVIKGLYDATRFNTAPLVLTLESIDRLLCEQCWRPDHDTLEAMSRRNPWIADALL